MTVMNTINEAPNFFHSQPDVTPTKTFTWPVFLSAWPSTNHTLTQFKQTKLAETILRVKRKPHVFALPRDEILTGSNQSALSISPTHLFFHHLNLTVFNKCFLKSFRCPILQSRTVPSTTNLSQRSHCMSAPLNSQHTTPAGPCT